MWIIIQTTKHDTTLKKWSIGSTNRRKCIHKNVKKKKTKLLYVHTVITTILIIWCSKIQFWLYEKVLSLNGPCNCDYKKAQATTEKLGLHQNLFLNFFCYKGQHEKTKTTTHRTRKKNHKSDQGLVHMKNSFDSIIKRQVFQFKHRQSIWTDTAPQNTSK